MNYSAMDRKELALLYLVESRYLL